MNRFIIALILTLSIFATGNGQQAKPEAKTEPETALEGTAYHEITVQDFENIEFKPGDIIFQKAGEEEFKVTIRDESPAPINSKKYLGVRLKGTKGNAIQIKFPSDKIPSIDKYVQSISMWVYGKNFTGELSLFISDGTGRTHKLSFGKLNFHGWHKLRKILPPDVLQTDKLLEQKVSIKILSILYVPGTWFKPGTNILDPSLQTFYIDDITANVREKYRDAQNDEW